MKKTKSKVGEKKIYIEIAKIFYGVTNLKKTAKMIENVLKNSPFKNGKV